MSKKLFVNRTTELSELVNNHLWLTPVSTVDMVIFIGVLVALIIKSDIIKKLINVKAPFYAHVSQGHSRRKGDSAAISQASSLGNTVLIMPPG